MIQIPTSSLRSYPAPVVRFRLHFQGPVSQSTPESSGISNASATKLLAHPGCNVRDAVKVFLEYHCNRKIHLFTQSLSASCRRLSGSVSPCWLRRRLPLAHHRHLQPLRWFSFSCSSRSGWCWHLSPGFRLDSTLAGFAGGPSRLDRQGDSELDLAYAQGRQGVVILAPVADPDVRVQEMRIGWAH